jgi:predicted transcriptional regulator
MARAPWDVTDAELAVLQQLWARGPSSRRQLAEVLYPPGGTAAYTTVQKLLERLGTKGYVTLQPGPGPRTFAAAVSRDELIGRRLRDMADELCDGSLTPLLSNLIRARPLTPRQVRELRDLLDSLQRRSPPEGKGR